MKVIFCADPLNNKKVDMDYESEYRMAKQLEFEVELMSFEDLVDIGNPESAIKKIKPSGESECAVYRGWILKPDRYGELYNALKSRKQEHLVERFKEIKTDSGPKTQYMCIVLLRCQLFTLYKNIYL